MVAGREPFNAEAKSPATVQQHSPWHSPVPYLFGGLAAMLGLIAFALLILACSYWKLSGYHENGSREGDVEAGEEEGDEGRKKPAKSVFEEKILVIMAGDVKPTFLATPISSRAPSIEYKKSNSSEEKSETLPEKEETMKEREYDRLARQQAESHTSSHQHH